MFVILLLRIEHCDLGLLFVSFGVCFVCGDFGVAIFVGDGSSGGFGFDVNSGCGIAIGYALRICLSCLPYCLFWGLLV